MVLPPHHCHHFRYLCLQVSLKLDFSVLDLLLLLDPPSPHERLVRGVCRDHRTLVRDWRVTPTFTDGLKEMLNRARTYSFGSICFGSLYFGMLQMLTGLSSFLASKRVPLLPTLLNWMASKIATIFDDLSEWSYVYIGMYGYSYSSGANNVYTLFANKGFDGIVEYKLAGNITFMSNLAIGLLTGFCGLVFGIFEYGIMWQSGLANPTSDGFLQVYCGARAFYYGLWLHFDKVFLPSLACLWQHWILGWLLVFVDHVECCHVYHQHIGCLLG